MIYRWKYETPEGFSDLIMNSDGDFLTELRFEVMPGKKDPGRTFKEENVPVFRETSRWLDAYFAGRNPDFIPALKIEKSTTFREEVLNIIREIPYGETLTYGDIAGAIAKKRGTEKMSAQAVGGAVGWNPICIIIPCHRVIGARGSLGGYSGGIENKIALLRNESSL